MNIFLAGFLGLAVIEIFIVVVYLVGYRVNKTSIVDIFWSFLILSGAIFYYRILNPQGSIAFIYLEMLVFWALRLALYIYFRNRREGEDPRYQALRDQWGKNEKKKMLIFYFQQGIAAWVFTLPFLILFSAPHLTIGIWELIGAVIWLISFNGEAISDAQLMNFKKNPQNKGRVCRAGFWKFSRHPNYFFEWLNWVAFAWLALPHTGGGLAMLCPMLIFYLLNKVSGIPHTEKQSLKSRSAEYAEYQRITPAFFLWFPKKSQILK